MRLKTKITFVTVGLGVAIAAGIAGTGYAATTGQSTGATNPAAVTQTTPAGEVSSQARGGMRADFAQDLAKQLGVPTQTVVDALKAVRASAPATGSGRTRSQQADALINALAVKLNLDPAKVRDAVHTVRAQERAERLAQLKMRLDQAVRSGKISQSDADTYLRVTQTLAQP
jgi:hypothetical protein